MQDQPQIQSEQEREPIFQLTDEFLAELGWTPRADQFSYLRKVYEKKDSNLCMIVLREPQCPPFIHFFVQDPMLAGPSEHQPKGNMYVQNVMDLKLLIYMVEYLPPAYQDGRNSKAWNEHLEQTNNLLLGKTTPLWPTREQQ